MQPAKVDPIECARRIVYAYAAGASDPCADELATAPDRSTSADDLGGLAGVSAEPFFPPNVGLTLLCVLLSVAIVAWSIAAP
jgi:hypothetical protein